MHDIFEQLHLLLLHDKHPHVIIQPVHLLHGSILIDGEASLLNWALNIRVYEEPNLQHDEQPHILLQSVHLLHKVIHGILQMLKLDKCGYSPCSAGTLSASSWQWVGGN